MKKWKNSYMLSTSNKLDKISTPKETHEFIKLLNLKFFEMKH